MHTRFLPGRPPAPAVGWAAMVCIPCAMASREGKPPGRAMHASSSTQFFTDARSSGRCRNSYSCGCLSNATNSFHGARVFCYLFLFLLYQISSSSRGMPSPVERRIFPLAHKHLAKPDHCAQPRFQTAPRMGTRSGHPAVLWTRYFLCQKCPQTCALTGRPRAAKEGIRGRSTLAQKISRMLFVF